MEMIRRQGPARAIRVAGAVALAVAVLVAGALVLRGRAPLQPPPPPSAPAGSFRPTADQWAGMTLATAQLHAFATEIHTEGRIAAADPLTAQVFSPVSGRVLRLLAQVGQRVRKGQPLAELAGVEYDQAAGDLVAAGVQAKAAAANEQRLAGLYREQAASLRDWQQSQTDLATAQNALRNARARLSGMGLSDSEVSRLGARGLAIRAPFLLRAPIDGVITQQAGAPGQSVAALAQGGANPLFVVTDLSRVWLVGLLRDADAAQARLGQEVYARPLGEGAPVLTGRVDFISPTVDPASRRVTVRATIANPSGALRPETFVDFALVTRQGDHGLAVPAEAVIYEGSRAHVWVADRGQGLLTARPVVVGRSAADLVEVRQGLRPGERVVTHSALFIDQAVKAD